MIKFENTEVVGWDHAIRGMRNPMNSWNKSDSYDSVNCGKCGIVDREGICRPAEHRSECEKYREYYVGENDLDLMKRLRNAGTDHRKFMRMITVYVDITAPLYWWKEFDTYKVGTVANSCSTMHKIAAKEFALEDFSYEHLIGNENLRDIFDDISISDYECYKHYGPKDILNCWVIPSLNLCREKYLKTKDKKYWWQMIQLLPSSYNQKRTVMLNYEVLANIYKSRKGHKLDEWSGKSCFVDLARNCNTCAMLNTKECHGGKEGGFIQWIESLPYSELITGEFDDGKCEV